MARDAAHDVRADHSSLIAEKRLPAELVVREEERFFTIRLDVEGLKVEYRDGVLELKVPKR